MNTGISGKASSDNIPNINPDDVEIFGTYPFKNKDKRFQITDDEACVIANRNKFILSWCKHN